MTNKTKIKALSLAPLGFIWKQVNKKNKNFYFDPEKDRSACSIFSRSFSFYHFNLFCSKMSTNFEIKNKTDILNRVPVGFCVWLCMEYNAIKNSKIWVTVLFQHRFTKCWQPSVRLALVWITDLHRQRDNGQNLHSMQRGNSWQTWQPKAVSPLLTAAQF